MAMKIAGAVLAGGRSRRFGRDKALALLGGRPLIYWSLEAIRPAAQVLAINGPKTLADRLDLPSVGDFPGAAPGPLAGLLGAMIWAAALGCSHILTAPCDTPFLPSDMAAKLVDAIGERSVIAARAGRVHALCAIWRTDLAEPMTPVAHQPDQPSLQRIIDDLAGGYVDFEDEARFANLNTPAEMIAAQDRWVG